MKKVILFFGVVFAIAAIWYFFIKSHDYQVTFRSKTFPGAINQAIKTWGKSEKGVEIIDQDNTGHFTQSLKFNDSTHIYEWSITPINDSLSKVRVYASDAEHSLKNKLKIPFFDTDFEKRTRNTLLEVAEAINNHIKEFKVEIIGEEAVKSTFCACTEQEKTQLEKASGMMRDYPFLSSYLLKNNLELNGTPFIEVTEWKKEVDSIRFKFCFPIIQTDLLPEHPEVEFRNFYTRNAIKAVYNGNYITSDRAWYALLDYAEKNDLDVIEKPVEVFFNNPNQGSNDAIRWRAEIYMPLQ